MSASSRRSSMVRDLCLTLAHCWEPGRIFVILTAYLDESGTHGGDASGKNPASPVTVMGGMMGTASQWARFAWDFDALRRKYGFRILHMKDLMHGAGDFRGWETGKIAFLLQDFAALIESDRMMEAVTFRLDNEKYIKDYRADGKGFAIDSAYGFCFRSCMWHLILEADRRLHHHKKWSETKLSFVLEAGHRSAPDALRIFNEVKDDMRENGHTLLSTLSFARKEESVELIVGDVLAYMTFSLDKHMRSGKFGDVSPFGSGQKEDRNLTNITHKTEGMANIRLQLIERTKAMRARKKMLKSLSSSVPQDVSQVEGEKCS